MIKGKRALLASFLFRLKAFRALRHFGPGSLVIFNYHRIRSDAEASIDFDENVYGPDQESLRAQFKCLKLNADVVSELDLLEHVRGRRKLPKSSVMVTFDDGYRDNIELALPVIQELRIPATFFVPTRAIECRELGWWDTIAYLVKKSTLPQIILRDQIFNLVNERRATIGELQGWMRTRKSVHTRSLITEISQVCGVEVPDVETRSRELMSWDQIREAAKGGVTIGSHTHSHRVLSTLSLAEQLEEFQISKQILEKELKQSIYSVAYPVGSTCDYHVETANLAEISGYELGFSFQTGANRLDRISPFQIARVSSEESLPLTCVAATLPSIFARSRCRGGPERIQEELVLAPMRLAI